MPAAAPAARALSALARAPARASRRARAARAGGGAPAAGDGAPPPAPPPGPLKLALVVNAALAMGKGKVGAQCAHGAVLALLAARGAAAAWAAAWARDGQAKIVLRAPGEAELLALAAAARAAGLPSALVRDAGHTQVPRGALTVAAIGPAPAGEVDRVTGALKLL